MWSEMEAEASQCSAHYGMVVLGLGLIRCKEGGHNRLRNHLGELLGFAVWREWSV